MKVFTRTIILITLLTLVLSWTAFFERLEEQLKGKKDLLKQSLNLESLGLSSLKDLSLSDLTNFKLPESSSKLEKLKHMIPKDLDPSHHKDIDEFWTGFFISFHLPKPTELIGCFGTMSGQVFFRKLRTINDLLKHSKENNNLKIHTDYAQFEVFMHALEHAHTCMFNSHDFARLTEKLHVPNDPEYFNHLKHVYYEAKFADFADDYNSIIENIDKQDFNKAGQNFAKVFEQAIETFQKEGEDFLAYHAFSNGLAGVLGTSLPKESLKCYDSKSAKILMDFFKGISNAVVEGRWYKADESTAEFWKSEGESLIKAIPEKVWKCDGEAAESKEMNEKLGMVLGSPEYEEKMWKYINDHNIMYYSYLRSMKLSFDKRDYLHAGASYGHLLESVAKSS